MPTSPTILWLRRDLRLTDNPGLRAALATGSPVVPLYVLPDRPDARWAPGGAARWWLHHSLSALADDLRARGSRLIVRVGDPGGVVAALADETGARRVVAGALVEPGERSEQDRVAAACAERNVAFTAYGGHLLFDPADVRTAEGRPYQQFTAFWRACRRLPEPLPPVAAPTRVPGPDEWPAGLEVDDLGLLPGPDRVGGLREAWTPGEAGARRLLEAFVERALSGYAEARDLPGVEGTSRLSPHLHFGELSPRSAWHAVEGPTRMGATGTPGAGAESGLPTGTRAVETFRAQLGWREFGHHLLAAFPHTAERPLRPEFASFPWEDDPEGLAAWQRGTTGIPLVDAGMRQLWHTGWMHNRVRMVAASFLVKDLLLPWQAGAAWFWDTLVDADLANNTLGWQWTAGSGADAVPYFRIFNPVRQGERFDPDGVYVRRWLPELADIPDPWVHRPWEAPQDVLAAVGVRLGVDYPYPIVDHGLARARAMAAFRHMRLAAGHTRPSASDEGGEP